MTRRCSAPFKPNPGRRPRGSAFRGRQGRREGGPGASVRRRRRAPAAGPGSGSWWKDSGRGCAHLLGLAAGAPPRSGGTAGPAPMRAVLLRQRATAEGLQPSCAPPRAAGSRRADPPAASAPPCWRIAAAPCRTARHGGIPEGRSCPLAVHGSGVRCRAPLSACRGWLAGPRPYPWPWPRPPTSGRAFPGLPRPSRPAAPLPAPAPGAARRP
jgi:hypothetical protein